MSSSQKITPNSLQPAIIRVSRLHFLYVIAFTVQSIIYDMWNLITPLSLERRWIMTALLLMVTTAVWYIAKSMGATLNGIKILVFSLVAVDIAAATFNVYTQRGMASRAVILYVVPIIVAAVLRSRSAIFATALLSVAAYSTAAIIYFVEYFNEGLKIELYGEVGFYSFILFVVAGLAWQTVRVKNHRA